MGHDDVVPPSPLVVTYAGSEIVVDERLGFGRSAALALDTNRFLHRITGEFVLESGGWYLHNRGSRLLLTVSLADGNVVRLVPGSSTALAMSGVIRFEAGPVRYDVAFSLPGSDAPVSSEPPEVDGHTTEYEVLLTPREVDFAVAFARNRLEGIAGPTPTYAQVGRIWNVSHRTVDNTMQGIKRKFRDVGIDVDVSIESLLDHLIVVGLVSAQDLAWARLDGPAARSSLDGPRFAGDT